MARQSVFFAPGISGPCERPARTSAFARQIVAEELVAAHGDGVERLAVGRDVPVDRMAVRVGEVRLLRRRLAVDGLLQAIRACRFGIVAGDVAAEHRVIGPAQVIDDDEGVMCRASTRSRYFAGLQIEDHEVRALDRPPVAAGRDVGDAARLIGRDADDALVRLGNRIDSVLPVVGS